MCIYRTLNAVTQTERSTGRIAFQIKEGGEGVVFLDFLGKITWSDLFG